MLFRTQLLIQHTRILIFLFLLYYFFLYSLPFILKGYVRAFKEGAPPYHPPVDWEYNTTSVPVEGKNAKVE